MPIALNDDIAGGLDRAPGRARPDHHIAGRLALVIAAPCLRGGGNLLAALDRAQKLVREGKL